jgi:hypothetical protein
MEVTVPPEVSVTPVGFAFQLSPEDGVFVDRVNDPLKPFWLAIEIDDVAEPPWGAETDVGFAETVKSGAAGAAELTLNVPTMLG